MTRTRKRCVDGSWIAFFEGYRAAAATRRARQSRWYALCIVLLVAVVVLPLRWLEQARTNMAEPLSTFLDAVFVSNVVLVYFLGLCPFLGVSKSRESAWGMGLATTVVLIVATAITWMMDHWMLRPNGLGYLKIISFILAISVVVQLLELALKKLTPVVHEALGIYLPLITTNCAVMGAALINAGEDSGFVTSVARGAGSGVGFALVIVVFAGIRERLARSEVPVAFRGVPIALMTAGILSMTVMGFAGIGG